MLEAAEVGVNGFRFSGGGVNPPRWASGGVGGKSPYLPKWAAKKWWLADMEKGRAAKGEAMAAAAAAIEAAVASTEALESWPEKYPILKDYSGLVKST